MDTSDADLFVGIAARPEFAPLRAFALNYPELEPFIFAILSEPLDEVHFQRNRQGGQESGSLGRILPIEQGTFEQWLLPRFSYLAADGCTTVEEYLRHHSVDALYIHDGRLVQVRERIEIENYLRERILRGWALPASLAGGFRHLSDDEVAFDLAQFHAAVWGLPQPLPLSAPERRRRKRL
ncbi:MAG TPA: hypothetical protein VIL85_03030 [Thermomicrobiales bacterium]